MSVLAILGATFLVTAWIIGGRTARSGVVIFLLFAAGSFSGIFYTHGYTFTSAAIALVAVTLSGIYFERRIDDEQPREDMTNGS